MTDMEDPASPGNLPEDQLKVLFSSPLGVALRQYLWTLLEEEVTRLHAKGRRAASTAGGVMIAQRIVYPEQRDAWADDTLNA